MFKSNEYKISFKHNVKEGVTSCYVNREDNDIYIGKAICSEEDQFNKSVGRKIALSRALLSAGISRPVRRKIWFDYFKIHTSEAASAGGKK
jgi:hypothetical protein